MVVGGASYRSWLTGKVALEFLGARINLDIHRYNESDKIKLYEDIAIACYGYTQKKHNEGVQVLIDSDPYLKRLIWSRKQQSAEEYTAYREHFETRVVEAIGSSVAPTHIVGINISNPSTQLTPKTYFNRIQKRGLVNDFDPKDAAEAIEIAHATSQVWSETVLGKDISRFQSSKVISVNNPECKPNETRTKLTSLALYILAEAVK